METAYLLTFILALVASFLGTIPFGIVNLTVVETTIRKDFHSGILLSSGAGIVEMLHGFLAVYCSSYISVNLEDNVYIKSFVLGILILLALYFFTRKPHSPTEKDEKKQLHVPEILRGAFFSLINPQALPFYIFTIAYLSTHGLIEVSFNLVIPFILGVALGRFLCLSAYSWLSVKIKSRMTKIGAGMNIAMGVIFSGLAIIQLIDLA